MSDTTNINNLNTNTDTIHTTDTTKNEPKSEDVWFITQCLRSFPACSNPKNFYASLNSVKFSIIIVLTISISVVLNGKSKCFSVLAADLENKTCNTINDTCGMATLNWIAFLGQTVVVGGQPFIGNMLLRVHSGVLGGRITYQFCMLLTLGALLTSFVTDPESLFVTDTIIQGMASAVLLGLVTFKIAHIYPEDSDKRRTSVLMTEIAPWFGVFLCPLYGYLLTDYGWTSTYIFIALIIMIICALAGMIEPKPDIIMQKARRKLNSLSSEDEDEDPNDVMERLKENKDKINYRDYWEIEDDSRSTTTDCKHPSIMQLLLNANIGQIISRPIVTLWLIEQAIWIVAEYNLVINITHYMTSVLNESVYYGSYILITLGVGCICGYITIYTVSDKLSNMYLLKIYIVSCLLLVITFIVWQIYGASHNFISKIFTVSDAHFVIIVLGVLSAMSNAQSKGVAKDIIERPAVISTSLTKLAQALGLLLGPITSGMLIQIDFFKSFFMVQAFLHGVRMILIAIIVVIKQKKEDSTI